MRKTVSKLVFFAGILCWLNVFAEGASSGNLEAGFLNPPGEAGVRCWWWWLNSNVTKDAITRDLEAMHGKGFSGAMIFDANGANQRGNANVPNGPIFGGPEWTELYMHALNEAKRLDLKIGLSIQSGWNLGGPTVTLDDKAKQLAFSETILKGPGKVEQKLPAPKSNYNYYRDICVLAWPQKVENADGGTAKKRKPISNLTAKTGVHELGGSAPDCRFLLNDEPSVAGEEDTKLADIVDITGKLDKDGMLKWDVPEGSWVVMRIGFTPTGAHVSTSSDNWPGHVLDYLSKEAFDNYWYAVIEPLLKKAGPLAGTVLTHFETDSWECGGMNWSPKFAEDFKRYNGYDIIKYLPVVSGRIVESREASNAFLADFRKTIAHFVSENHYKTFAEHAARYNTGIQPECSGPHAGPIDGIKNYSHSDIMMSEFWAPSPHRPNPPNRFFVKQASSAAHIYGKKYVGAESFTTIGPHWNDLLWHAQKPSMDYEFCEGLNMVFFHTFTCSPKEMGMPGQEYFAGTHVNPQVTWWDESGVFMDYINRIQFIVQQGSFVADVLYYYGDHVPNIAVNKGFNSAGCLPGYDYDVTGEDVLLRLKVEDGRLVVPACPAKPGLSNEERSSGGVRYRVLVLPDHKVLSLAVLKKVGELLEQGATVLGSKPERCVSMVGGDKAQKEFSELAAKLWGANPAEKGTNEIGEGRLVWGCNSRELLLADGLAPDFEALDTKRQADYEYIHYTIDGADVYFVCNQTLEARRVDLRFRVTGRHPEFWDPATGNIRKAEAFSMKDGRTTVPVYFDPHGSMFVIFRSVADADGKGESNFPEWKEKQVVGGPWQVTFDPAWGGPKEPVRFDELMDWTKHSEPGIKHYSGKAVYRTTFKLDAMPDGESLALELGSIKDVGIARVTLNGKDLGAVWLAPFRVDISGAAKAGENQLEIMVVNSWRNRVAGDLALPEDQRLTKTNIRIKGLVESGLLGPVRVVRSTSGLLDDPPGILRKPIPDKLVVLTFDDACVTHATYVAPMLKSLGFGGSFYICAFPSFTNKNWYMSWDQMKEMTKDGFEMGNHTRNHNVGAGIGPFLEMEKEMVQNGLPKPVTQVWPCYVPNANAFADLASNKYIFARGGYSRPYRPTVDHPFDIPSFSLKDMKAFTNQVPQAKDGSIVVLTYHGVPDYEHGFAGCDPGIFKEMMQYLKDNNYKVIGLRDLAEYIDPEKAAKLAPTVK